MPHMDIFNDDAFGVASLTNAINEGPATPSLLGSAGVFEEEGISTTTVSIEKEGTTLSLVPAGVRGEPARPVAGDKRKLISFNAIHLPQRASILADEVQNVRAFGSESEIEAVQTVVNKRLVKMRRNIDATIEHLRIGAIKGKVLDADGASELLDVYASFGLEQISVAMALNVDGTNVRGKVITAIRKSEDELGAQAVFGYDVYCGDDFFDAFVDHAKVIKSYERFNEGEMLRNDPRAGFVFAGARWINYRGKVGANKFIAADEAYLVPVGVPELCLTKYAPADYMETANTNGLPYYAKQEPKPMNKGVDLEAQSNPLCLVTRPTAIIKLTRT